MLEAARAIEVATKVMGWKPMYLAGVFSTFKPRVGNGDPSLLDYYEVAGDKRPCGWSPFDDPSADYEVLVKVRSEWDEKKFERFFRQLWHIWASRQDKDAKSNGRDISQGWGAMPTYYETGDYACSALAVASDTDPGAVWDAFEKEIQDEQATSVE